MNRYCLIFDHREYDSQISESAVSDLSEKPLFTEDDTFGKLLTALTDDSRSNISCGIFIHEDYPGVKSICRKMNLKGV